MAPDSKSEIGTLSSPGLLSTQEDKSSGMRTEKEWDEWRTKCPVKRFAKYCLDNNLIAEKEQGEVQNNIRLEIEEAFEYAQASETAEWI